MKYSFQNAPEFEKQSTQHEMYILNMFGPITVIFSVMGGYAAYRDRCILLILYVAFMTCEFIAIVIVAVPMLSSQPKMEEILDKRFESVPPLHNADPKVQRELNKLQASDQCCGLRSHSDWGCHIPISCYCPKLPPDSMDVLCETVKVGLQNTVPNNTNGKNTTGLSHKLWVYSKPCGPILKGHMNFLIKVMIGFISTFATIMISVIVLSVALVVIQPPSLETPIQASLDRVKYQLSPLATT
ncbi:hypothetical protein UPYG_G00249600 [Umbra pygmaea]|uniref:Tetraspanin n=1 Tax=Umbra pygmaea TaxID=75934 RepID=A0ABD0WU66_UMBPY